MVRLQPFPLLPLQCYLLSFQSHYGAIATCLHFVNEFPDRCSFNPTMVRLQLFGSLMVCTVGGNTFNPTMVRLQRGWLV